MCITDVIKLYNLSEILEIYKMVEYSSGIVMANALATLVGLFVIELAFSKKLFSIV